LILAKAKPKKRFVVFQADDALTAQLDVYARISSCLVMPGRHDQRADHPPNVFASCSITTAWKDVDLRMLSGQALRNATAQIFADSTAASSAPESYGETLRIVTRWDPETGMIKREFYGDPSAWTNQFKSGRMFVQKFRTGARYDHD
jgi:hypothetical protein